MQFLVEISLPNMGPIAPEPGPMRAIAPLAGFVTTDMDMLT